MAKTDTRGLERFAKKVSLYKLDKVNIEAVADAIAEQGRDIAMEIYGGHPVTVSVEKSGAGGRRVVAVGEGLSFMEFGTGIVGLRDKLYTAYNRQLPTETIVFESPKGHPQQTQGWEYNYENPFTKQDGKGWFFGGKYTQGQPAQAQMFRTAERLRREMPSIAISKLKKGD